MSLTASCLSKVRWSVRHECGRRSLLRLLKSLGCLSNPLDYNPIKCFSFHRWLHSCHCPCVLWVLQRKRRVPNSQSKAPIVLLVSQFQILFGHKTHKMRHMPRYSLSPFQCCLAFVTANHEGIKKRDVIAMRTKLIGITRFSFSLGVVMRSSFMTSILETPTPGSHLDSDLSTWLPLLVL